jgi:hypothetical protein
MRSLTMAAKGFTASALVVGALSCPAQAAGESVPGNEVDFVGGYTVAIDHRPNARGSIYPAGASCEAPLWTTLVSGSILQEGPAGVAGMTVTTQCVDVEGEAVARYRAHLLVPGQDITLKKKAVLPLDQMFVRIDHGPGSMSVRVSNRTQGWTRRVQVDRFVPEIQNVGAHLVLLNHSNDIAFGDLTVGGENFGSLDPTMYSEGAHPQCAVGGFEDFGKFFRVRC